MKLKIKEGTASKLIRIFIQDSSSTTGAGLTGLVYNSSGLTAYYLPEGDATATAITLATMTAGTWASGGFDEVDATNMPGVYEVGLPDAVVDATSEGSVLVMLKGATNMAPVLAEIELDAIDYRTGLNDISAAQVNAEVLDVLNVDTFAEPASIPAATSSLIDKISWLFTLNRNKLTQTSTTLTVRNDADGADIAASTVSDDGTTFTRGEYT